MWAGEQVQSRREARLRGPIPHLACRWNVCGWDPHRSRRQQTKQPPQHLLQLCIEQSVCVYMYVHICVCHKGLEKEDPRPIEVPRSNLQSL